MKAKPRTRTTGASCGRSPLSSAWFSQPPMKPKPCESTRIPCGTMISTPPMNATAVMLVTRALHAAHDRQGQPRALRLARRDGPHLRRRGGGRHGEAGRQVGEQALELCPGPGGERGARALVELLPVEPPL